MLNNLQSPAAYMQAAFRAQNAYAWDEQLPNGQWQRFKKKNAYIFDFAPERTLMLVDDFANNLNLATSQGGGTSAERQANIQELLNFFPVIGEDAEGRMQALDASQVLTIPKFLKAREVVNRGFMSNLLFANISHIFQTPKEVLSILNKLKKTPEGKDRRQEDQVGAEPYEDLPVDSRGEVTPDQKIVINTQGYAFKPSQRAMTTTLDQALQDNEAEQQARVVEDSTSPYEVEKPIIPAVDLARTLRQTATEAGTFQRLGERYGQTTKKAEQKMAATFEKQMTASLAKQDEEERIARARRQVEYREHLKKARDDKERETLTEAYEAAEKKALTEAMAKVKAEAEQAVQQTIRDQAEALEREKLEKEKFAAEEDVRGLLRGFSRTLPSFIMAYGDRALTLANFEAYTPAAVFLEVTGITIKEFQLLRDGGTVDVEGEKRQIQGGFFDEAVFNQSVQEFLDKREALADYFTDDQQEDIFDYIPIQETNQIFTPKWVVKQMVEQLEVENPGIYDDLEKTFIDLYMKSGLYITEVVKRLYNSPAHQKAWPDPTARLRHIFERQVYGLAPTEIIYRIARRFIFGGVPQDISRAHFKCFDAYPAAREGRLEEALADIFKD